MREQDALKVREVSRSKVVKEEKAGRRVFGFCISGGPYAKKHSDVCCKYYSYHPDDDVGISAAIRVRLGV